MNTLTQTKCTSRVPTITELSKVPMQSWMACTHPQLTQLRSSLPIMRKRVLSLEKACRLFRLDLQAITSFNHFKPWLMVSILSQSITITFQSYLMTSHMKAANTLKTIDPMFNQEKIHTLTMQNISCHWLESQLARLLIFKRLISKRWVSLTSTTTVMP